MEKYLISLYVDWRDVVKKCTTSFTQSLSFSICFDHFPLVSDSVSIANQHKIDKNVKTIDHP